MEECMDGKLRFKVLVYTSAVVILTTGLGLLGGYKYGRTRLRAQMAAGQHGQEVPVARASFQDSGPSFQNPLNNIHLFLPKTIFAVPGVECRLFFENLVDCPDVNQLRFRIKCALDGGTERRCWKATSQVGDVGEHPFEVVVTDLKGGTLARADAVLKVAPSDAGKGGKVRLLIVGDSLTHTSLYPYELKKLMSRPGNPALTMIGTHTVEKVRNRTSGQWIKIPADVRHEGYGGWTWHDFVAYNQPGMAKVRHRDRSPFLYNDGNNAVKLDVERYLRENSPEGPPDLILFQLGINDVFSQDISEIIKDAQTLVGAFRKAAPKATLAVWLTQPVNYSEATFTHLYKGVSKQSTTKTRQHQLAQALTATFGDREGEGIFVVPMHLGVDPIDDYWVFDAVHPTPAGYERVAQALYAWMKWWLARAGVDAT
jgi:lysophospholipase L1-like esterase